jgi:uncharacterized protein (TIGR02246 family)
MHTILFRTAILWVAVSLARPAAASADPPQGSEAKIRRTLEAWPKAFNMKDKAGTCSLFAPDLVASYPGQPDKSYDAMCKHLGAALDGSSKAFRYEAPQINEILVSGDLAVVRLIWVLHVTDKKTSAETVVREVGIDVFKRQKDGTWKVSISHAYPEEADREK